MKSNHATLPLLAVLLIGSLFAAFGQKVEQLRVTSGTVVVDVVATDKNNRNVTDLRKEDLQVFENESRQEIDAYEPVHRPTTAPPDLAKALETSTDPNVVHASREALGNLMVVLLDYATVEFIHQDRVRQAAIRYVKETMHSSDVLAVFRVASSFQMVQNFTGDKQKLVAALEKMEAVGSKFAFDQAQLAAEAQRAQNTVQMLISNLGTLRGGSSGYGPTVAMAIEILSRQQEVVEQMEARAYAQLSVSKEIQARPVIAAVEAVAAALQPFPGRKTLILFSEGFAVPLALEKHLYHAVDRANKSNVAVYAIDSAGLRHKEPNPEGELRDISALQPGDRARVSMGISQFDRAREIGSDQTDSTLRFITSATGGVLVRHTNDLFGALRRIDNDIRSYYILTYRPSNSNFDGSFRNIKVTTSRPGVALRFRQGYFAVPPGASLITPDEYASLIRARSGKLETDEEPLYVQPYSFLDAYARYRVLISIEFPVSLMDSKAAEGGVILYPKIWGTAQNESGEVVTSYRSPAKVTLTQATLRETGEQLVSLTNELSLAPGRYSLEVFAQPREKHRPSYQVRSLNLEYPPESLSLSSIVMSSRSSLNRRTASLEHYPSATRQFRSNEKLIFYLHAYNPARDNDGHASLEVRSCIMNDTKSFVTRLDPFRSIRVEKDGVPHVVISRFVDLENLSPGRYQLETKVTDLLSNETALALAPFTVIK